MGQYCKYEQWTGNYRQGCWQWRCKGRQWCHIAVTTAVVIAVVFIVPAETDVDVNGIVEVKVEVFNVPETVAANAEV